MEAVYNIPLKYKSGKFHFKELPSTNENCLVLSHNDEYNILFYSVPNYETEVRLYFVPKKNIDDSLSAFYDDNGELDNIEVTYNGRTELVYIHFANNEIAKENIWHFTNYWSDKICDKILQRKEKLARLFIEYFQDGETFDIAAKVAAVSDTQTAIKEYGGEADIADYSGNYPVENRIELDNDTLRIMMLCTNPEFRNELFGFAVYILKTFIEKRVLDAIDKTDDFKFIVEDYD